MAAPTRAVAMTASAVPSPGMQGAITGSVLAAPTPTSGLGVRLGSRYEQPDPSIKAAHNLDDSGHPPWARP
jgi:hypothetical protein